MLVIRVLLCQEDVPAVEAPQPLAQHFLNSAAEGMVGTPADRTHDQHTKGHVAFSGSSKCSSFSPCASAIFLCMRLIYHIMIMKFAGRPYLPDRSGVALGSVWGL